MLKRKMMRLFFGKSRKIYVDLGANEGETIAHYLVENPSWPNFWL